MRRGLPEASYCGTVTAFGEAMASKKSRSSKRAQMRTATKKEPAASKETVKPLLTGAAIQEKVVMNLAAGLYRSHPFVS